MKCLHQTAIDQGNFEAGWLLTGLSDPLRRERFGGEPEELEIVSQYTHALDEVEKRARKGAGRGADEDDEHKVPRAEKNDRAKGGKKGEH